jgi:hypothetical protein
MHNDSDDLIDLSALDPLHDRGSFEAHAARIAGHAMDARDGSRAAARAEASSIVIALMSLARPTVLAAGILVAIALSAVVRSTTPPSASTVSAADAMGLPRRLTDILHSTAAPSLTELEVALAAAGSP